MPIKRHGTPSAGELPYSQAVEADGWLYVSGQVPEDASGEIVYGSMVTQARVTLQNLKSVVESAGYSLTDVVRVGVWIDDPRDFAEFNQVYKEVFSTEHAPARVTVNSPLMSDIRLEVDCIAYKKK